MKNPKFLVKSEADQQLSFELTARNGQLLLQGPVCESIEACRERIQAIRQYAAEETPFQRQLTPAKQWYFELVNPEGEVVATGRPYSQRHGCERGIRAVTRIAPLACVEYPDGSVEYAPTDSDGADAVSWDASVPASLRGAAPMGQSVRHGAIERQVWLDRHGSTAMRAAGMSGIPVPISESPVLARRKTTLQGRIVGSDGTPVAGVTITIPGQDSAGYILSRGDGSFMMTVHGGGVLPIRYEKSGFMPIQRRIYVHWQDFFRLPDVVLTVSGIASEDAVGLDVEVAAQG